MPSDDPVLVTGGSGVLGRAVIDELVRRSIPVHAAMHRTAPEPRPGVDSRSVDLTDRTAVRAALAAVGAVIHCATDPRRHRSVDLAAAEALAAVAGDTHLVFPGIVGSELVPLGYYRSKTAAEAAVMGARRWTIRRATHFHQLLWRWMTTLSRPPVMLVPNQTRFQVIDPASVAGLLVDAVEGGPQGRAPDIGGPFAYEARDLARSYLAATGRRRAVAAVNLPGLTGAAFRAGANLTGNRDRTGMTWNQFVDRQTTPA